MSERFPGGANCLLGIAILLFLFKMALLKLKQLLMPPEDVSDANPPNAPNLLQLTSCTFLVPAAVCVSQNRLVGVFIHSGNAVCSVYVHRPDRTSQDNFGDVLDHLLVFFWVVYNSYLLFVERPLLSHVAVGCAVVVLCTKVWTRYLNYRSFERYMVHSCMHLFGTFGSLLLLI